MTKRIKYDDRDVKMLICNSPINRFFRVAIGEITKE